MEQINFKDPKDAPFKCKYCKRGITELKKCSGIFTIKGSKREACCVSCARRYGIYIPREMLDVRNG